LKGTRHNGRSGKDGVYNPLHNDRRFDPEHSEHIDNERVRQNIYWDCYQGYTTMADRGKEDNFSFNQIEMAYYVDHYSDYVINQNKRHEKARHPDRCKGVEDVLKNKKTCPEESIYQLGTIDEHASVETLVLVFDEFKKEFDERFGSNVHIIDWSLHMDEATPHIHERHVFDATNRYGEIEPKQEAALEELGFELPNPEKKRSKTNNRKVVFDSACRTMFLDICKRHGLEIDEEPSYGGRQYLEKQDYIRMKQKEEIAVQQEMLNQQRDKVNANHLELARQSNHVRANEKVIQSQKEKIEQQEKEFKENFISNSDRILSQGELIEEQREELQQLTLRIEDVETLLDEVSSEAYDKAVDKVAEETMRATRKDDIRLAEDSKRWIQSPERKASRKEKEYAINRLDGLIKEKEYAMEKAVVRVVRQLKQPEKKKAVVEEIKKEVKPSIREKLALNVAKIQREEAERKQLNKGRSHSSDLEL
jgi:archaellum component FlaC